jgi:hypothetical protein
MYRSIICRRFLGQPSNDLWRYHFGSGLWTWLSGSQTVNNYGVYGELGIENTTNMPGSRYRHTSVMQPHSNVLLLFGGIGSSSNAKGMLTMVQGLSFALKKGT